MIRFIICLLFHRKHYVMDWYGDDSMSHHVAPIVVLIARKNSRYALLVLPVDSGRAVPVLA